MSQRGSGVVTHVQAEVDGTDGTGPRLRVEVLGPLCLAVDGREAEVPGERRRAVLALLAVAGGRTVPVDALLDAVWPSEVPESGRRALHSLVSRLRGHLGAAAGRLARDGAGYRLALGEDELDAAEARALAARARGRPPAEAAALLGRALALWRGPALDEFPDVAPLAAEAVALAELRRDLVDDWLEARLAAGATGGDDGGPGGSVVVAAARAAADEPRRERTHGLLVRALAGAGRQAEALRAAHEYRRRLADEAGLDPSPAFAALEQDIAVGALAPAPGPGGPRPIGRPAGPLVGREHEIGALRRLAGAERLVTVIGPGGVGKTRLTLEVAADIAGDGGRVVVVELATVDDPRHVVDGVGAALGVSGRSGAEVLAAARDALSVGNPLVVVDNCEHVLDTLRDLVAELLAGCPGLTLVATSREPLGLPDEHLLRLGPLPVPEEDATDVLAVPAVAAFLAHARRRTELTLGEGDVPVLAEVVRRLDGLPLALELAAGRAGTLSLADLHARLDRALDLLAAGRPSAAARHRTLRATIDWSYRALGDDERRLLGALGVFPGGVDLATAERLGERLHLRGDPASLVARLVDSSMLVMVPVDGVGRYRALETVRSYVLDALDAAGERSRAEDELVAWAVDLTAELGEAGRGPDEAAADVRLRRELPNLRAAWDAARRRGARAARVAMALHTDHLKTYRALSDLTAWTLELAEDPGLADDPRGPEVLGGAAVAAWLRGDLAGAERLGRACLEAARTPAAAYRGRDALAAVALFRGDLAAACDRWLAARDAAPDGVGDIYLGPAALAAAYAGDEDRAGRLLAEAFAYRDAGPTSVAAFTLYTAAELEAGSDPDRAVERYTEAIRLARTCGATFVEGVAAVGLVRLWAARGRTGQALAGYRELLDSWRRSGHWTQMWTTLRNLAGPLAEAGRPREAALLLAAADQAAEAPSVTVPAVAAELAALEDSLRDRLGEVEMRAIHARAGTLSRAVVVDEAIAAVDAALGRPVAGTG